MRYVLALVWPLHCLIPTQAWGQTHLERFWQEFTHVINHGDKRLRVDYENDVMFNIDRNYTSGVRATYKAVAPEPAVLEEGDWAPLFPGATRAERLEAQRQCGGPNLDRTPTALSATVPKKPVCLITTYSAVIGQNLYTPSDIRLPSSQIAPGERPYAAWLYAGFYRELYASDDRYWRYGLDIGCLGPCAQGEQVQSWIHQQITRSPRPQGWDSQIRNEIGVVLRYEYGAAPLQGSLGKAPWAPRSARLEWDLHPRTSFGLGNVQTYAGIGLMGRIGWLGSAYQTQRLDNRRIDARERVDLYAQASSPGTHDLPVPRVVPAQGITELYAFGRVYAGLMAYNALLQGGLFNRSSPTTTPARPVNAEVEAGVGVSLGAWVITASLLHKREWQADGTSFVARYGRIAFEMPF